MDRAEFDRFADEYASLHRANIAVTGEGPEYFARYKIRDLARLYRGHAAPAILDFGAGVGTSVPYIREYLPSARLTCVDVSQKSLEVGKSRFPDQADFVHFDGTRIPFDDGAFDIVFAACVFHHIDHDEHARLLAEIRRVLAPDGIVFIFEHNPLNPLTVRAVNTCPFDENAHLISGRAMRQRLKRAGFEDVKIRYRVFFPHALRVLRPLEQWLTWMPFGAQYYALATR